MQEYITYINTPSVTCYLIVYKINIVETNTQSENIKCYEKL